MSEGATGAPNRPHRLDTLWVFLVTLAAHLAVGQRTLYGVDGWRLLRRIAGGDRRSDMHLLYKPGAVLARDVGAWFGVPVLESVVAYSALGTAIGVAAFHLASRWSGLARRDALLVALLVGVAPGVVWYASVVERHGPFFAFAGLSAIAAVLWARWPGPLTALALALGTTLAYAAHSTGVLLLGAWLPFGVALARHRDPGCRLPPLVVWGVVAIVATGAGMVAARELGVWVGVVTLRSGNLDFFLQHAAVHVRQPWLLPVNTWQELVVPFVPASILWLVAFWRPALRGLAIATVVGLLGYQAISFAILGGFEERGAYTLPMVWPLAWLTVACWSRRVVLVAAIAGAGLALGWIVQHDVEPFRDQAAAIRAIAPEPPGAYLIAAAPGDFELIYAHFPDATAAGDYYDAFDAHGFPVDLVRTHAKTFLQRLEQLRAGRPMLMTARGLAFLETPADVGKAGPLVLAVLANGYRFEPAGAGFDGYRLVPR